MLDNYGGGGRRNTSDKGRRKIKGTEEESPKRRRMAVVKADIWAESVPREDAEDRRGGS